MEIIDRLLKIDLSPAQSAFLLGPEKNWKNDLSEKRIPEKPGI